MKRGKRYKIVVFAIAFALFVALACTSLSKFVFQQEDYIVGSYTDFVISHDGDGQTAILQSKESTEGTEKYNYEGYITLSVSNFTEDKISKRNVAYSFRAPEDEEIEAKEVTDAWGKSYSLAEHSGNYSVDIVGQTSELEGGKKDTEYLTLRIRRKSDVGEIQDTAEEYLTVILETTKPYHDLQVFTINASTSLISVNASSEQDYHGVPQTAVNLKTSRLFVRESQDAEDVQIETYIAQVTFTLSGDVVFDVARFEETYSVKVGEKPADGGGTTYTFSIPSGSDMNLYFYTSGTCKVTVSATIGDNTNVKISGVTTENNINTVFSK